LIIRRCPWAAGYGIDREISAPNLDGETFAAGSFSWKDLLDLLDKPRAVVAWDAVSIAEYMK